jgi:hypothetical protein
LLETGDNECASLSYAAGLMHDLGKVILAANFDQQYHGAHNVARKQQLPLWEVEKDLFGATHGEIGAYLLGLWGLPPDVVKVAAFHHQPFGAGDETFTPLTAVHVANALEYETNPDTEGLPVAALDMAYLQQLGLETRVQHWRDATNEPDPSKIDTRARRKSTTKAARPAAAPAPQGAKMTPAPVASQPAIFPGLWKWTGVGLAACAAVVALARLEMKTTDLTERPAAPAAEKSALPAEPKATVIAAPIRILPEAKPAPAVSINTTPIASTNATPAVATNAAPALAANPPPAPRPQPAPPKMGLERLRLEAIFFTANHPTAMLNGNLAAVNEVVEGCRVLEISPSSVTLQYKDQRKTFTLK